MRGPLLALVGLPAPTGAGDVALTIEGCRSGAETVKLKRGDRLVVANQSAESHFVWGHSGDYAFVTPARLGRGQHLADFGVGRPESSRPAIRVSPAAGPATRKNTPRTPRRPVVC